MFLWAFRSDVGASIPLQVGLTFSPKKLDFLNGVTHVAGGCKAFTHMLSCVFVQLAAQWLVIGSGEISLHLQREIGLSTFLAAIQTYCLKVRLLAPLHPAIAAACKQTLPAFLLPKLGTDFHVAQ